MAFPARVFRILIASPSDVTEERDIAVRTIQEWNDLNAAERQVVILPLRWETHSAPEFGKRPQGIINAQVVDNCDLLVGVFWTRVGSPTGVSDSGTVEEIERVAAEGKPVMLYFSKANQDPDKIDVEQLAKLREFKKKTIPNALIENYSGVVEFRDKLSRQLEYQLRSLLARESDGEPERNSAPPITDIVLHFSDVETGNDAGLELQLETQFIEIANIEQIPDYSPPPRKSNTNALAAALTTDAPWLGSNPNKNYFRQLVTHQVLQGFFRPVRFWLKNRGGVGARDVYIEISIQSKPSSLVVVSKDSIPSASPSEFESSFGLLSASRHANKPEEVIRRTASTWSTHLEFRALQPQREIMPDATFLVGATETCDIAIGARIFADTLPEPVQQTLKLRLNVARRTISADELIPEFRQHSVESQPSKK